MQLWELYKAAKETPHQRFGQALMNLIAASERNGWLYRHLSGSQLDCFYWSDGDPRFKDLDNILEQYWEAA